MLSWGWPQFTHITKKKTMANTQCFKCFQLGGALRFGLKSDATKILVVLVQFSSVQLLSCAWLCKPMNCSMPGFPVHHQLPELAQTHVHWVRDAIQPSHRLSSLSSPAFKLSQHQGLSQWGSFSHQVAKVLEFQFQHQSFQWIFRSDFL